ncbi:MAG: CBS domain-containing protein [Schwartzia succinivorans]|nr:CBS domain-containing protein [Schwartzia succinivorans]
MQAKDVMHRGVISVLIDTTAEEIAKLMIEHDIRAFLS